jgi:oxygen-independent coproporphyrinogen-3 oxidase
MFAIPGQSIEQWESDLREAAMLGSSHLSTYCLTFEEDTALYVKLSQGKVSIDEDKELLFYERGWEMLAELGYAQYEISNFARPGAECMHNMNTWRMHEWMGFGPSAASQYKGERYQRPASLSDWCVGVESGVFPKAECVRLDDNLLFADAIIFGLRMNAGVDLDALHTRFTMAKNRAPMEARLRCYEAEGLVRAEGTHYALTHQGRLLCDAIGSDLIGQGG